MSIKEISCELKGKVQGVGLRYFAKSKADEFGIVGYIANNSDGTVSVEAQGNEEELKKFIELLEKGTVFSQIDSFEIEWHTRLQDPFMDFSVR